MWLMYLQEAALLVLLAARSIAVFLQPTEHALTIRCRRKNHVKSHDAVVSVFFMLHCYCGRLNVFVVKCLSDSLKILNVFNMFGLYYKSLLKFVLQCLSPTATLMVDSRGVPDVRFFGNAQVFNIITFKTSQCLKSKQCNSRHR